MAQPGAGSTTQCSSLSQDVGEPAIGTAAEASCWVVLEQDGPWGAKAATQSRLDPGIGRRLDVETAAVGGRFALMRRPGAHPDRRATERHVVISGGPAEDPWLVRGIVARPERLLEVPWEALADTSPQRLLAALPEMTPTVDPILLVCTNGKRDRCCAIRARPLAEAADAAFPGRVVETTHLGGHRFAPTAVILPYGQTYARLDEVTVVEALHAADERRIPSSLADATHHRGRSHLLRPQQAAEHAYRLATGDWSVPGPYVGPATLVDGADPQEGTWTVPVGSGERGMTIVVSRATTDRRRPESCGKEPVAVVEWRTHRLESSTMETPLSR
ncbi:sucrase ferredoxin [Raineyella fluvialis]|uniref:Sucrase ferredoxin n=1 Tax=Raineyella fluvialis TaxID=2662261 RepID=A0A5Q2FCJ1_9ACTN|nr:sucrase ferredoxin [Raineyella fluvialis]QGF24632.1 sucrase ferredoxin [Raineyella fluvialis]